MSTTASITASVSLDRRSSWCTYTFTDGRRCRTPHSPNHPNLCTFHARKEAEAQATQKLGKQIARDFSGHYTTACDLTSALRHLFTAVAQGHIKPHTANTLAYLGQTMVQSIHYAQNEYVQTFGTKAWKETIAENMFPEHFRKGASATTSPLSAAPASTPAQPATPSPQPPSTPTTNR
jgi:hypothetical protein